MRQLHVNAYAGEFAITTEDGNRLYQDIHAILKAGGQVNLDFTGVRVFASPFFNAAIGGLLKEFRPEEVRRSVTYSNLTGTGVEVRDKVLRNAEEYYYKPEVRKALDEMLKENSDDADK